MKSYTIDGHSDVPMDVVNRRRAGEQRVLLQRHLPEWRAGQVGGAILSVWSDDLEAESASAYAKESLGHLSADVAEAPNEFAIVHSADEFIQARDAGKFAIAMNFEGARAIEGKLENLERAFRDGVRFMTLTWNYLNEAGAGAACKPDAGGLTPFGIDVARRMAQLGMVTDISHSSPATFWQTLKLETGNVVASHSSAAALCPHVRNLTDDQIRAVAEQGGYIGVCFFPSFIRPENPTMEHVVDHIAYVADLVGIEHVTLGPDYIDYVLEEMMEHLGKSGVPYGDSFMYPAGVETTSQLQNLGACMLRRGFSADDIRLVSSENLLRIWKRIADSA